MKQYLDLLSDIFENGHRKNDRTGTGTMSVFGRQMRFDLQKGFPLVTTKKCHLRSIIHELLWFIKGDTNTKYLTDNNVTIWNEWQDENGNLGPVYGKQWRKWPDVKIIRNDAALDQILAFSMLEKDYRLVGLINDESGNRVVAAVYQKEHDQISSVMEQLRTNPDSRRIIVSAWNVGDLADMALEPCHSFFQFYSRELSWAERMDYINRNEELRQKWILDDKRPSEWEAWVAENNVPARLLSCQLTQRSADAFLGVPFNIASYALLVEMMAHQLNMMPGEFVWTGGDVHLYDNHQEQAELQLSREPLPLPRLKFNRKPESIFDYKFEDFEIVGYQSHEAIKAPVAI